MRCKEIDRIKKNLSNKKSVEEFKNRFYIDSIKATMHEIFRTTDDKAGAFIECVKFLEDIDTANLVTKDEMSDLVTECMFLGVTN